MNEASNYEVEMKFRLGAKVDGAYWERLQDQIRALGGEFGDPVEQRDTYFAHPHRNFQQTDEALRIRRVGDQARVTYKGPKIDATTKTRRELEFAIASESEHAELFDVLGFAQVSDVCKSRRTAQFQFQGWDVEACLDEVEQLGAFLELETTAVESQVAEARDVLLELAEQLALKQPERRGYLDLLLEQAEED